MGIRGLTQQRTPFYNLQKLTKTASLQHHNQTHLSLLWGIVLPLCAIKNWNVSFFLDSPCKFTALICISLYMKLFLDKWESPNLLSDPTSLFRSISFPLAAAFPLTFSLLSSWLLLLPKSPPPNSMDVSFLSSFSFAFLFILRKKFLGLLQLQKRWRSSFFF